jgi:hypothetical protein
VLSTPLADVGAPSYESPSQNLIATMTQTTITSPHISISMPFSATDFTMGLNTCPTMATDRKTSHRFL